MGRTYPGFGDKINGRGKSTRRKAIRKAKREVRQKGQISCRIAWSLGDQTEKSGFHSKYNRTVLRWTTTQVCF